MKIYLSLIATLCLSAASHAAVLFEENFDSLDSGSNLVGQHGWINYSGVGAAIVDSTKIAWSPSNYLNLFSGGGVRNGFTQTSLSESNTAFSFYFSPGSSVTAGHNLEISLRNGTGYVFYLNLRGARNSVDVGLSNTSTTNYALSNSLSANSWYRFDASIDASSNELTFSVLPAAGGGALVSQSIVLTGGAVDRLYFGSSASTASGDWSVDSVRFASIPEGGTVALTAIGCLIVIRGSAFLKKRADARN